MEWSTYSEAIFDAYLLDESNIVVQAVPGAGKTTNIRHMWSLDDRQCLYVVFGKDIQVEATAKLPVKEGSDILTLNSLGFRAVRATFGNVKLDNKKVLNIIRQQYSKTLNRDQHYTLAKSVELAKCGTSMPDEQTYLSKLNEHDVDEYEGIYQHTCDVLHTSDNTTDVIDFADQLRFPVLYDCKMPAYEVVLGDEVQDFNSIQAALLQVLRAPRYVLVGDRNQSVYGFRGAMLSSMDVLQEDFACTELPLSINYRCGSAIVAEAAKIYPVIQPWDKSPTGTVRDSTAEKEAPTLTKDDLVLCRLNRPLIEYAYKLLNMNVACHVRGRNIGEGLVNLVKRQKATSVQHLLAKLDNSYQLEMLKAQQREDDAAMQRIEDKYNSLHVFCGRCDMHDDPQVVIDEIDKLFQDGRGVCLSTVHKAKGLEAQRCLLLASELFDFFRNRAKRQWQRIQENNIKYVAITRAKEELVYM